MPSSSARRGSPGQTGRSSMSRHDRKAIRRVGRAGAGQAGGRWLRGCVVMGKLRQGSRGLVVSCDDDLLRVVQQQTKRGLRLRGVKENLAFTGEDSPMAQLVLSIL